jgi:hypothetical protein
MPRARRGPVELAVRRDLARLDDEAKRSGLAASALALAQLLDGTSPLTARDQATVAAELRQTLAELGKRATPKRQEDEVDQLRARRDARRAGSAG